MDEDRYARIELEARLAAYREPGETRATTESRSNSGRPTRANDNEGKHILDDVDRKEKDPTDGGEYLYPEHSTIESDRKRKHGKRLRYCDVCLTSMNTKTAEVRSLVAAVVHYLTWCPGFEEARR